MLCCGRYLLKVWILKHKRDEMYRAMWEAAMDEMIAKLVFTTEKSGLTYVAEMRGCALSHSCLTSQSYTLADYSLHPGPDTRLNFSVFPNVNTQLSCLQRPDCPFYHVRHRRL